MNGQLVLLGDSIFDNAAYVPRGRDVSTHLRSLVDEVHLLAVDGAIVDDVHAQLSSVPADAGYLVLSAGGNDALRFAHLLGDPTVSGSQLLSTFAEGVSFFDASYWRLLEALVGLRRPIAACTIYNGNLPNDVASQAAAALGMFNDVIYRRCAERGVQVIELRDVCTAHEDYANPIEPSAIGGRKIAEAIARLVTQTSKDPADPRRARSRAR
jgi:hypothetical protein